MYKFTIIALMILQLAACASGVRPEAMVAPVTTDVVITENSPLWKSTGIGDINGAAKNNPLWKSKVSKQGFEKALRETLNLHALLSDTGGKYKINAVLKELRQPFLGLELAVTARVQYIVVRTQDNGVVFDREVTETHTAKFNESFVFSDRLNLANEGAIKENIKKFVRAYIAQSREAPQTFVSASTASVPKT